MKTVVVALALVGLLGLPVPTLLAQEDSLVLIGVIVAENPLDSIALLRRAGARRARPMRLGNHYGGYVLVAVTRDAVVLKSVDDELRLVLGGTAATPLANEWIPELRKVEDDPVWVRRSFSRIEANERLEKEIPVILSDTEVTPRVVEGQVRGIELLRLPDGTVLSESGLLPGDVVQSINEQPLRGLDSLWRILAGVAELDEVRLVLERRGEVVRLAYDLTN